MLGKPRKRPAYQYLLTYGSFPAVASIAAPASISTAVESQVLKYRWFQKKPWQEEIKRMLASGLKYELDALADKDFRYLTKTYLPRKLKEEDWLD